MLAKFSGLNPKGPYQSLEKEKNFLCVVLTYFIKRAREIRKFHVAFVQQRLRSVQKSVMHVQSCFFALNLFFCYEPSPLQKLLVVVIQKFWYHGNMTSHFSLHLFCLSSPSRFNSWTAGWNLQGNKSKRGTSGQRQVLVIHHKREHSCSSSLWHGNFR